MLLRVCSFFFFNDTATTEIYPLSLHDALPIFTDPVSQKVLAFFPDANTPLVGGTNWTGTAATINNNDTYFRSEEHTSELQSQSNLVCRLLLEKKKPTYCAIPAYTQQITTTTLH